MESKYLAERAAWKFVDDFKEDRKDVLSFFNSYILMFDKDNFHVAIVHNFDFELRFIVKKEIDDCIDTFLFSGWQNFAYSVV